MTDILLDDVDGSYLTLNARAVKLVASDFMLDDADRHHGGSDFRRALVHDQGDGLTLNFGGDYPGGVTIAGTIVGPLHTSGPVRLDGPLHTSGPVRLDGVAEVTPQGGRLVVHGDISYQVRRIDVTTGRERLFTVILNDELDALRTLISDLTARVAALEAH